LDVALVTGTTTIGYSGISEFFSIAGAVYLRPKTGPALVLPDDLFPSPDGSSWGGSRAPDPVYSRSAMLPAIAY